jgi:fatty acid desaturase
MTAIVIGYLTESHMTEQATSRPPLTSSLTSSEQDAKLERVKRRVRAIKGFYIHFMVFVVVMLILVGVNIAVGPPWWVLFVLVGWGVGVLAHALAVFGHTSRRIAEWEQRKIRQMMEEA